MTQNDAIEQWLEDVRNAGSNEDTNVSTTDDSFPLQTWHRPTRRDILNSPDHELETRIKPRWHFYSDVSKSEHSDWTKERFKIEFAEWNGREYTFRCTCGNDADEPANFCPHRAKFEWSINFRHAGTTDQYSVIPNVWYLTWDEYSDNDRKFEWNMAFENHYNKPDSFTRDEDEPTFE